MSKPMSKGEWIRRGNEIIAADSTLDAWVVCKLCVGFASPAAPYHEGDPEHARYREQVEANGKAICALPKLLDAIPALLAERDELAKLLKENGIVLLNERGRNMMLDALGEVFNEAP